MVKHLTAVESEQKKTISDLEADILACHSKEAELLAFSEKMTAKNAQLQSEASGTLAKVLNKMTVIINVVVVPAALRSYNILWREQPELVMISYIIILTSLAWSK